MPNRLCLVSYQKTLSRHAVTESWTIALRGDINSKCDGSKRLGPQGGCQVNIHAPVYCPTCLLRLTSSNSSKMCVRATEGCRGEGRAKKQGSWAAESSGTVLEDVVYIAASQTPLRLTAPP